MGVVECTAMTKVHGVVIYIDMYQFIIDNKACIVQNRSDYDQYKALLHECWYPAAQMLPPNI